MMIQQATETRKPLNQIYICDPVCVQGLGHNLAAINRYSGFFRSLGISSKAFVSRLLAKDSKSILPENCAFSYSHYYAKTIPASNTRDDALSSRILDADPAALDQLIQAVALDELRQIVDDLVETEDAGIYFPSIDYYSFSALVQLLEENPFRAYPRFFVRWIGVMENCCYDSNERLSLEGLCNRLSRLVSSRSGIHVSHSAESNPYANKLSALLDAKVITTPTLVLEDSLPLPSGNPFVICFPGSARIDKGYNRVSDILRCLESKYPQLDYRVFLQMLPKHELSHHYNVARDLMRNSRVRSYPSHVSQAELTDYISASSLVVTPYCNRIYEMRSSAIMAEGHALVVRLLLLLDVVFQKNCPALVWAFVAIATKGLPMRFMIIPV